MIVGVEGAVKTAGAGKRTAVEPEEAVKAYTVAEFGSWGLEVDRVVEAECTMHLFEVGTGCKPARQQPERWAEAHEHSEAAGEVAAAAVGAAAATVQSDVRRIHNLYTSSGWYQV